MIYALESTSTKFKARMQIKHFKSSDAMYTFLNTGGNSLSWKESNRDFRAGTYAYAGGNWHNVKSLDASVLAHI